MSEYIVQQTVRLFPVVMYWSLHLSKPQLNLYSSLRLRCTSLDYIHVWSSVQTDAALLANNSQHCWMLRAASVCTPCCMLLRPFARGLRTTAYVALFSKYIEKLLLVPFGFIGWLSQRVLQLIRHVISVQPLVIQSPRSAQSLQLLRLSKHLKPVKKRRSQKKIQPHSEFKIFTTATLTRTTKEQSF